MRKFRENCVLVTSDYAILGKKEANGQWFYNVHFEEKLYKKHQRIYYWPLYKITISDFWNFSILAPKIQTFQLQKTNADKTKNFRLS